MSADKPHPTTIKTVEELAREWDTLAPRRHQQISSGLDTSFDRVLSPLLIRLLDSCDNRALLDIGCGTGELTARLEPLAGSVVAVDLSAKSLTFAKANVASSDTKFLHGALENLVPRIAQQDITVAVAAMTLMTVPNLESFAESVAAILEKGTHFVVTITHPWFWPRYWEYENEPWFSYSKEIFIEAPFRISTDATNITTTHIHRPLEMYLRTFEKFGFVLEALREPILLSEFARSHQKSWDFPRFLGIRWAKVI